MMAENLILFSEIRSKIIDGNLKEALLKFNVWSDESESYLCDEIAQRLAHFNSNERSYNLGNISNTDYEIEKNKITKAALLLLDEAKISVFTPYRPVEVNKAFSINSVRTIPKDYSTTNDRVRVAFQETPNATLTFIKKNMLWIALVVVALVVSIIIYGHLNPKVYEDPPIETNSTTPNEPKQ